MRREVLSYLACPNCASALQLVTVTREEIAATSVATTTDLLRRIPQLSGFNSAPAVRADPNFSTNLPSIHGLAGAGLVLTLVDGLRAPGAGINTNSFDPSSIPTSALERVEVVPDGASAVYGSDAVTGVVNLVLRRNLNGVDPFSGNILGRVITAGFRVKF